MKQKVFYTSQERARSCTGVNDSNHMTDILVKIKSLFGTQGKGVILLLIIALGAMLPAAVHFYFHDPVSVDAHVVPRLPGSQIHTANAA